MFIHVGLPKSGSSFLQHRVFPYLEKKGLLNFLNVQKIFEIASRIVFEDSFNYNPEDVRREINRHIKPGVNVITVEWFSGVIGYKSFNTYETARRLWKTFPNATILLILRNQVDFAYSAYKQHVHQGGTLTLEQYFNYKSNSLQMGFDHENFRFDDHKLYWNSLLYSNLLSAYQNFHQKGQLKLFLFENFIVNSKKFTKDFLSGMGLTVDLSEIDFSPINLGYGKGQIRLARLLNRFVHSPYNQVGIRPIPWFGKYNSLQAAHIRKILQSDLSFKLLGNKSIRNSGIDTAIQDYFYHDNLAISSYISPSDHAIFHKKYLNAKKDNS